MIWARQAGISKRTIYRYFSSKDEIIESILDNFLLEMRTKVEELIKVESNPQKFYKCTNEGVFYAG